jgi:hypothetical protein
MGLQHGSEFLIRFRDRAEGSSHMKVRVPYRTVLA